MPVLEIDDMVEAKRLHEYLPTDDLIGKASAFDHSSPELIDHERPELKNWFIEKCNYDNKAS